MNNEHDGERSRTGRTKATELYNQKVTVFTGLRGLMSEVSHGYGSRSAWVTCETLGSAMEAQASPAGTSAVERALDYVYKDRATSCTGGTEDVLPLQFDHGVWNTFTDPAIRTANLLSKLLVRSGGTLDTLEDEIFFLLVRNNVHGDSLIFGSAIALEPAVYSKYSIFCPYAYKKNATVRSHDLSINYNYLDTSTEWYNSVKVKSWQNVTIVTDGIMYRVNNTLLPETEEVYPLAELKDGHWTYPYYDCGGGDIWMVTYSSPIFKVIGGLAVFQGVATIDIELQNIDINQCELDDEVSASGLDVFRGTHRCQETTECIPVSGLGFVTGAYNCWCKRGYYFPHPTGTYYSGTEIEKFYRDGLEISADMFRCTTCAPGCDECTDSSPCLYKRNEALLVFLTIMMAFTIVAIVCVATLAFLYKSEMVIKTASPIFLELMCIGGAIQCIKFFFLYPEASYSICILRMWPMHTGFIMMYGSLIIKTWRISVIFSIGTKRRVRLPDHALLRRIGILCFVAVVLLSAWTALQPPGVLVYKTDDGLKFFTCDFGPWDYAALGVEIVLLLYGVYLCFTVRKAPAHFNESRHITWAVYNAIILGSFMAFVSSFVESTIGPNLVLVLEFIQLQVYVTVTLALIFAPKFYALYKKIEISPNAIATIQIPAAVGTVQTVTGRVKKTSIAPAPSILNRRSIATQTGQ